MEALDLILSHKPPLDRYWEDWRPAPAWEVPELVHGWDSIDLRE